MEAIRLRVGCTKYPNIGEGQIGFASSKKDKTCLEPRYSYLNGGATGYIHIRNHEELYALAKQIGAMTKTEFLQNHNIKPSGTWKNDYIYYLDKEIARALLNPGIKLTINEQEIEFYTTPDFYTYTDIKPAKNFRS